MKIPEPGVPQIMTLEGNFVRVAYNNEGYVILGYQIANRTVGEDWIMLYVGITMMEKVPTYELKRDALSLDTPDGTVPLPSIEEYRKNESKVQPAPEPHEGPARLDQRLSTLDYWREPARVLRGPRVACDAVGLGRCHRNSRACVGQLYFHVPGGTKHGQDRRNAEPAQSVVRVPFRHLTKDEEKTLSKNYGDIKKQVKAAFSKKA